MQLGHGRRLVSGRTVAAHGGGGRTEMEMEAGGRTGSAGGLAVGRRRWTVDGGRQWTVVGRTRVGVRTGRTKVKSGVL